MIYRDLHLQFHAQYVTIKTDSRWYTAENQEVYHEI